MDAVRELVSWPLRVMPAALVAWLTLGCVAVSSQPSAPAQMESVANLPIPLGFREHSAKSSQIGRQLYELDKASAIATEVFLKHQKDYQGKGLAGYLSLQETDADGRPKASFLVSFFTGEDPPRIAYQIRVAPEQEPTFQELSPPQEATPEFAMLARARQVALAGMPATGQPINPIVLPGSAHGEQGILVYLIAGTRRPNIAVLGRHFRSLVAADGGGVKYMMPLSNSILEIPTRGPNGEMPEGLTVTHLVTDFPLETHVFASLLNKMPLFVSTRVGLWRVDGDKISLMAK